MALVNFKRVHHFANANLQRNHLCSLPHHGSSPNSLPACCLLLASLLSGYDTVTLAMPKIISHTPSWLSRPNPGFHVFGDSKAQRLTQHEEDKLRNGSTDCNDYVGSNRTIAHRGAEIFVVVGNQIRWADLTLLKEGLEQSDETPSKVPSVANGHSDDGGEAGPEDASYRVWDALKSNVHIMLTLLDRS